MTKIIKHIFENNDHLVEKKFKNLNIKKILLIQPPDSDKKIFNFKSAKRGRLWNYPPYGLGVLAKRIQKPLSFASQKCCQSTCRKPRTRFA